MSKAQQQYSGGTRHEITGRMKALAAVALAQKVGHLRLEDLPASSIFETLPTRSLDAKLTVRTKDELFLVREGQVEIRHIQHGFFVKELKPGTLFGEMPLLGQTMLGTKAITGEEGATLVVMDVETAKEWVMNDPVSILLEVGQRLIRTEADLYRSMFQLADSKIATLLLELAGKGSTITGLTQQEIGERLGLYRETVTHRLQAMKSEGLIEIGRKSLEILDKRVLKNLSEL